MQVSFVTVSRTGLSCFRKNVISSVQDVGSFAKRMELQRGFRPGDRVNSARGPGLDPDRSAVFGLVGCSSSMAPFPDLARDQSGFVVFPGTVREVRGEAVVVDYDVGGEGLEHVGNLKPRVRMPWNPKQLQGQLVIMLRRNLGRGRGYLEGLEVRWGRVAAMLRALTDVRVWRSDGVEGPMHRWCDPRLFDVCVDESALRAAYGEDLSNPSDEGPEGLARLGLDVREYGEAAPDPFGVGQASVREEPVEESAFGRWLELSVLPVGSAVGDWWVRAESSQAGCDVRTTSARRICLRGSRRR